MKFLAAVAYLGASLLAVGANAGTLTVLHALNGQPDGTTPIGNVAMDRDGNLYGETADGGAPCTIPRGANPALGCGTVYKLDPAGAYTVLVTFNGANGAYASSGLVLDGKTLFGTTSQSQSPVLGVIYAVSTSGTGFRVLHRFNGADGAIPTYTQGLVIGHNALFGITSFGGTGFIKGSPSSGDGVLYRLDANGIYTVLHDFAGGSDGFEPLSLIAAPNGLLYGTALGGRNGGGVAFSYDPGNGAFKIIYAFTELVLNYAYLGSAGADGTLYGASTYGDIRQPVTYGTLFSLGQTSGGFAMSTLWTFTGGADGSNPAAGPRVQPDGSLIGNTYGGSGQGSLYRYANSTLTPLYSFPASPMPPAPSGPSAPPLVGPNGVIYDTTGAGGAGRCFDVNHNLTGCGTIFKFTP